MERATLVLALLLAAVRAQNDVAVVRLQLALEETHALPLNTSVEYILQFTPNDEQAQWPRTVWASSEGAGLALPLMLTARLADGTLSWQLPFLWGESLLSERTRTLCGGVSALTLHVSSVATGALLRVRVSPHRDWMLPRTEPAALVAEPARPALRYYEFQPEERSVRLAVRSDDLVCATVAILELTCHIPENVYELGDSGLRMTVQRSGGVQLSRNQFPNGFVLAVMVQASDDACDGVQEGNVGVEVRPRYKELEVSLSASLTRAQYAVGTLVVALVFLLFYLGFGAFVLAQRWPAWARLVAPRAVLAPPPPSSATPNHSTTRRRLSDATFDSSDNSDSECDDVELDGSASPPGPAPSAADGAPGQYTNGAVVVAEVAEVAETGARPFGLPAQLHLAALSRRRGRTLRARSDRYLYMLYTVAVFYALPVIQFVVAFQLVLNVWGSLDLCYYNFLCSHPAGQLSDFNHVYSNLGYLMLGALFMLQVRRRRRRRKRTPKDEEYGIPAHYGLLNALGASMMAVALLSACYHVCPNRLNFQFDVAFMYVLAVLSMVKIYQSRHPDVNARAHSTFGVLAVLIALVVWGVLGGGPFFWGVFSVAHVFTFLLLSLRIYYVGQFRLERRALAEAARGLATPLYSARLVLLLIANALNWLMAIYGLWSMAADFAGHLLSVLLGNTLLYMMFYICMKLLHGERLRWYAWVWLVLGLVAWGPAVYLFMSGSSDWSATPAHSRHSNHECRVLRFYDSHDLWHMLSAVALYFSFNVLLTWDDGLSAVKKTEIAVF